jgi:hypothetical protein
MDEPITMKKLLILILWSVAFNATGQSFFPTVSGSCFNDSPVELGTKFTTSANATISALRFYKCNSGTQVYTLKLYSGTTLMASVTYSGTATGWVSVTLPVAQNIIPGVNYTVSYYSTSGYYQASSTYTWPVKNGTLTATVGVYRYGAGNTVPIGVYQTSNYFADVIVQGNVTPPPADSVLIGGILYLKASTINKDTVTLPCYPPDSSYILYHDQMIEKYLYYFVPKYRDTGSIVYRNIFIHDTMYLTKPTEYIRDTIIIRDSIPYRYPVYYMDTVKVYDTVKVQDTTFVLTTFDGYDSTNYKDYFDRYFEVEYFNLPNGQKFRFRAKIEKHWYKEQWDDFIQDWIRK